MHFLEDNTSILFFSFVVFSFQEEFEGGPGEFIEGGYMDGYPGMDDGYNEPPPHVVMHGRGRGHPHGMRGRGRRGRGRGRHGMSGFVSSSLLQVMWIFLFDLLFRRWLYEVDCKKPNECVFSWSMGQFCVPVLVVHKV